MNTNTKTINNIAREAPAPTTPFEDFKTDYCCGSRSKIADACSPASVDFEIVAKKIEDAEPNSGINDQDFVEKLAVSELIDHIVEKHHTFTRNEIGRLILLLEKVCHKHGAQHPELHDLRVLFGALCDDMTTHMRQEEFHLFPYMKSVQQAHEKHLSVPFPRFGTIGRPIRVMMGDHDTTWDFLKEMRSITKDFSPPADACPSFKALYQGFEDLE